MPSVDTRVVEAAHLLDQVCDKLALQAKAGIYQVLEDAFASSGASSPSLLQLDPTINDVVAQLHDTLKATLAHKLLPEVEKVYAGPHGGGDGSNGMCGSQQWQSSAAQQEQASSQAGSSSPTGGQNAAPNGSTAGLFGGQLQQQQQQAQSRLGVVNKQQQLLQDQQQQRASPAQSHGVDDVDDILAMCGPQSNGLGGMLGSGNGGGDAPATSGSASGSGSGTSTNRLLAPMGTGGLQHGHLEWLQTQMQRSDGSNPGATASSLLQSALDVLSNSSHAASDAGSTQHQQQQQQHLSGHAQQQHQPQQQHQQQRTFRHSDTGSQGTVASHGSHTPNNGLSGLFPASPSELHSLLADPNGLLAAQQQQQLLSSSPPGSNTGGGNASAAALHAAFLQGGLHGGAGAGGVDSYYGTGMLGSQLGASDARDTSGRSSTGGNYPGHSSLGGLYGGLNGAAVDAATADWYSLGGGNATGGLGQHAFLGGSMLSPFLGDMQGYGRSAASSGNGSAGALGPDGQFMFASQGGTNSGMQHSNPPPPPPPALHGMMLHRSPKPGTASPSGGQRGMAGQVPADMLAAAAAAAGYRQASGGGAGMRMSAPHLASTGLTDATTAAGMLAMSMANMGMGPGMTQPMDMSTMAALVARQQAQQQAQQQILGNMSMAMAMSAAGAGRGPSSTGGLPMGQASSPSGSGGMLSMAAKLQQVANKQGLPGQQHPLLAGPGGAKPPKGAVAKVLDLPGRFKVLPPDVQFKIQNITSGNQIVLVKDFDEKVVSKMCTLVEKFGSQECLIMLDRIEEVLKGKQGRLANGPGYLDVSVSTRLDELKQKASGQVTAPEDYARATLHSRIYLELKEVVDHHTCLTWEHFDQGIVNMLKKMSTATAQDKLNELAYHSFKNVENVKSCIVSILTTKPKYSHQAA